MRPHKLVLALALTLVSSCTFGTERDYALVVSWLLNGFVPDAALCQELGVATARLEVRSRNGSSVKTLEAPCDRTVATSAGEYGGFLTSRSFAWEVDYTYRLTLLDASGNQRSTPAAEGSFYLRYDEAEEYELGFLDFVDPKGQAAALYGEWSVGQGELAAECATKRVARVRIVAVSAFNEEFEGGPVLVADGPCTDGKISSNGAKILARGDYLFRYEAYSDGGAFVQAGQAIPVVVDGFSDVILRRELFLP